MDIKKQIVISGYYGFDNTGDEAVLFSIIQALYKNYDKRDLEITVLSNQPEKTREQYGVKAINRWDIKSVYLKVKDCDLLISGGGSLLQDVTSNKTIPYYLLIIKIAQLCKKEVIFYAQGFGPVNQKHNKFLVKRTLNKVANIFVRDKHSKKALEEIGVTNPSIIITADPVLGMETNKQLPLDVVQLLDTYKDKTRLGIYLRSWKDDKRLIDNMEILCRQLRKEGIEVFFIPMQLPEDADFLQAFSGGQEHKVTKPLDVEEVFALTGQMDIVVGMRLHALIMATAQGVPTLALSYDPKVDGFMNAIGNPDCFNVSSFDPYEVARSIMNKINNIDKEKEKILYKRQGLLKEVYEPAKCAGSILKKEGERK